MKQTGVSSTTIYCINLKSRPDRWAQAQVEFAKTTWNVERFDAITGGARGCLQSHQAIISKAFRRRLPYVFITEDDLIIKQPQELFDEAFSRLPEDWELLYFGGKPKGSLERHNHILHYARNIICTQAIVYSERVYGMVLNGTVPIDQYLRHTVQRRGKSFFADFTGQRSGYSDIKNREVKGL